MCTAGPFVTTSAAVLERIVPRSGNLRGTIWNMVVLKDFIQSGCHNFSIPIPNKEKSFQQNLIFLKISYTNMCKRHVSSVLTICVLKILIWRCERISIYYQVHEVFRAKVSYETFAGTDWPKCDGKTLRLIPRIFDSEGLRWRPICSLSNNSPSEADVAGPRTTLWEHTDWEGWKRGERAVKPELGNPCIIHTINPQMCFFKTLLRTLCNRALFLDGMILLPILLGSRLQEYMNNENAGIYWRKTFMKKKNWRKKRCLRKTGKWETR